MQRRRLGGKPPRRIVPLSEESSESSVASSQASTRTMNTLTTQEQYQAEMKRQAIRERKQQLARERAARRNAIDYGTPPPILQSQPAGSVSALVESLGTRSSLSDIPNSNSTMASLVSIPRSNSSVSTLTENTAGYGGNTTSNIGSLRTNSLGTLESFSSNGTRSSDPPSNIGTLGPLATFLARPGPSARSDL